MSKKKKDALYYKAVLYTAVFESIMQQRVNIRLEGITQMSASDIDKMLFQLEITIGDEVTNALGLDKE